MAESTQSRSLRVVRQTAPSLTPYKVGASHAARVLRSFSKIHWLVFSAGVAILAAMIGVMRVSPAFAYGNAPSSSDISIFVITMIAAGGVYVGLLLLIPNMQRRDGALVCFILLGALMRLAFFTSTPIYEDDWYRYLWDGAAVSNGVNPYKIPPADTALLNEFGQKKAPAADPDTLTLQKLGADQAHWPERINYPFLTTIYPPLAQAFFALAYRIEPFSLDAWRFVLLIADFTALAVILSLLRQWNRSPYWALLYWWNPVVIVTTFNAAHMDILLVPVLGAAILLTARNKPSLGAIALSASAGIKFWPIILAPILFRRWRTDLPKLASIIFVLLGGLLFFVGPMFLSFTPDESGLSAYANNWQRNAFLFPIFVQLFDGYITDPDLAARLLAAILPVAYIAWLALQKRVDLPAQPATILLAVVLIYFCLPTGYPWYATWFFMLLPLAPSFGAAIFAVTLPIYYLRYSLEAAGQSAYFNQVLVPIEFGIPLLILFFERARLYVARRRLEAS